MYDSTTKRLTKRGQHTGIPRIWMVKVWAKPLPDTITFTTKAKCQLTALSDLIDDHLKQASIDLGVPITHIRRQAMAR
jgi:hypothetical protein